MSRVLVLLAACTAISAAPAPPEPKQTPWPMLGGGPGRNMANLTDRGIPDTFDPNKDVLWTAALGTRCHTQPVVAGGRVYIGTNNENPRNKRDVDRVGEPLDRGILLCLDEKTGKFLWQAVYDPLPVGPVAYWPKEGVCSTPAIDGDRLYHVSIRGELVCLDTSGFANGNQGVQTEKYATATDADVVWSLDMIKELGVEPHCMSASSPLVAGDTVFVVTGNGVVENHVKVGNPDAPSFIAVDKKTGKLLWKDNSPGKNIMHGQWSSPAYTASPAPMVVFPGGDGWLRGFDPATGELLWKFDCNPKAARNALGGLGDASDFLAAPVIHNGKLYVGTGQDPEHTTGIAHFWCIDLKRAVAFGEKNKDADVSPVDDNFDPKADANKNSALAWHYGGEEKRPFAARDFKFGRTLSTATVVGDVVYVAELHGYVHCLNATNGHHYWKFDTKAEIWHGTMYADGKVFVGTSGSELIALRHSEKPETIDELAIPAANAMDARTKRKEKQREVADKYLIGRVEFDAPIRSAATVANGVLYVATEKTLYAVRKR